MSYHGEIVYSPEYDEWVPYCNGYYVSKTGHVMHNNKLLKPKRGDREGHLSVTITDESGHRRYEYIHRMVKKAFDPYHEDNHNIVRHLNDDKSDNRLENLAWGTQADNLKDARNNGTAYIFTESDREKSYMKSRKPIVATNAKTGKSTIYRSINDAVRDLEVQQSNVCKVLRGERDKTCNYKFSYVEDSK